jgi:GNAT superfamily N-acetyltransferase
MSDEIVVREFVDGDEAAFRRLNEEWITRYFKIEAKDEETFGDPRGKILATGGRIFFAVKDGQALGCCALVAMRSGEFEVSKMAVTESAQGLGIGRLLMESVVEAGRVAGATRLYLETHHSLTPAIRLYERAGFERLPEERLVASPYERADVFMERVF